MSVIRRSYKLTIDNPCEQNWEAMKMDETGRFCQHCSKSVIDFTQLTDKEIIKIIEQNSGKICGRLNKEQLDKFITTKEPVNRSRFSKILAGLLLVGIGKNAVAKDKTIQTASEYVTQNSKSLEHSEATQKRLTDSLKNMLSGTVIDSATRTPVSDATILIQNTHLVAITDSSGQFKLVIPDNLSSDSIHLVISYIGYKNTEIFINKTELPFAKQLELIPRQDQNCNLILRAGGITIKKKEWWQFWKK